MLLLLIHFYIWSNLVKHVEKSAEKYVHFRFGGHRVSIFVPLCKVTNTVFLCGQDIPLPSTQPVSGQILLSIVWLSFINKCSYVTKFPDSLINNNSLIECWIFSSFCMLIEKTKESKTPLLDESGETFLDT